MKMKDASRMLDLALIAAAVILGINMFIRIIDLATIIRYFPLDYTNDITSYLGQLHFLRVCGFHAPCPYWYNGFITFLVTPPGWYFFAFPLYMMMGSVTLAFYVSVLLLIAIAAGTVITFCRKINLTKIESVAIFFFLFGNAIAVGNFLRLGRVHAFLNTILMVALFFWLWRYEEKKIDKVFFVASIVYGIMLITHYQETVLVVAFFAGLWLAKTSKKERLAVALSFVLAFAIASWWLMGFAASLQESSLTTYQEGKRALDFQEDRWLTNTMTYLAPISFLFALWWYKKSKKKGVKELKIFLPSAILAVVYATRLYIFVPVLRNISQDPYILFFMTQAIILLFTTGRYLKPSVTKFVAAGIVILAIISVAINMAITPSFEKHTAIDREMLEYFPAIEGRYLITAPVDTLIKAPYSKAYYTYGAIYHSKSTADGWSPPIASAQYLKELDAFQKKITSLSCGEIAKNLMYYNTTEVLSYRSICNKLKNCGWSTKKESQHFCLHRVP